MVVGLQYPTCAYLFFLSICLKTDGGLICLSYNIFDILFKEFPNKKSENIFFTIIDSSLFSINLFLSFFVVL